eukprot:Plantae.Rhodophyta-Purpureofilum_apyrenoidigerum.ctg2967.p2 GENE.Plantae.Rhodophyta-Purpureofilum_apyrenoidigerum.ctg2967~~Plantae.Rhodophyta-Purpureofilum_apyrenoidigerum.ctg2967.p2  ORF type:complete len:500 (+),score=108.25 Plantae.Rhodophyta-Purpureofilum_apyrenoidigerum.ctg2967:179-1678(+)
MNGIGLGFVGQLRLDVGNRRNRGICRHQHACRATRMVTQVKASAAEEVETNDTDAKKISHWLGKKHRKETKDKISRANKGNTPWNKGKQHSEETRRKIAERTRAAMLRPEMREKMRRLNVGRKHDMETKRKIKVKIQESNTLKAFRDGVKLKKGKPQFSMAVSKYTSGPVPFEYSTSMKEKLNSYINVQLGDKGFISKLNSMYEGESSAAQGGTHRQPRKLTDETRRKLSQRIREMWADPAYRERVVDGMRLKLRATGRRPLSSLHRTRIRESLLLFNSYRVDSNELVETDKKTADLESKRIKSLEKKKAQRDAREKIKVERKLQREKNRQREQMRSQQDRSLVEILRSSGALPDLEQPGIVDLSKLDMAQFDGFENLPAMHLDFDSEGDHVTTLTSAKQTIPGKRGRKKDDELTLDGIEDLELGGDTDYYDDDDDQYDDWDDDFEEEEEYMRLTLRAKSRLPKEDPVKKTLTMYIDGLAFEVDQETGERTPVAARNIS